MAYVFKEWSDTASWDRFVAESPQGNVFCHSAFLDVAGGEYRRYVVEDSGAPVLAALVYLQNGEPCRAPAPFTMYQGVMVSSAVWKHPVHSRVPECLRLTDFLLAGLKERYRRISFCLHHAFDDLRSFLWFHYHQPQLGRFNVDVRYTGLIPLSEYQSFDDYLASLRTVRRQEVRKAEKAGWTIESSMDVDLLDDLHAKTFARQGLERDEHEARFVRSLARAALDGGFGALWLCKGPAGEVAGANLFLFDQRHGYYMFGANDPEYRKSGSGTFLLAHCVRHCLERRLQAVDVVGINSPNRGDFKTSFNAAPRAYHVVTWEAPD
jgi:hypothetical protein